MPIEAKIEGMPMKDASVEHQIIAVLTKKLGGEILFALEEEVKHINGFMMQVTPHGNLLLKAE
jgi:hypothetical protein